MHKIILQIFMLVLFSCGQKSDKEANQSKTGFPLDTTKIEFKEKMHNFGELVAGEIVVCTFKFTNRGVSDYVIENIESDCGCVTTEFSEEPVKSGKTGLIEVEFNSSGMFGKQFKTIEIHGNSKELKHLAIFAEVKNEQIEIKY